MARFRDISKGWKQTVAPSEEVMRLLEVKDHLRVHFDDDDPYLVGMIAAARGYLEDSVTHRQFVNATYQLVMDEFHTDCIELPRPPLVSITSIQYTDTAGDTQTWSSASYDVSTTRIVGRVVPASGESWPSTQESADAVTVTYVAGYGGRESVPATIKQAILVLCAQMYDFRSEEVTGAVINRSEWTVRNILSGQIVPLVA